MTKKKLNTYTSEFKESAVKLVHDTGDTIPKIAKNLGINANTLYTWIHNVSKIRGLKRNGTKIPGQTHLN